MKPQMDTDEHGRKGLETGARSTKRLDHFAEPREDSGEFEGAALQSIEQELLGLVRPGRDVVAIGAKERAGGDKAGSLVGVKERVVGDQRLHPCQEQS